MPMDVSTAALGNPRISHSQDSSQAFTVLVLRPSSFRGFIRLVHTLVIRRQRDLGMPRHVKLVFDRGTMHLSSTKQRNP